MRLLFFNFFVNVWNIKSTRKLLLFSNTSNIFYINNKLIKISENAYTRPLWNKKNPSYRTYLYYVHMYRISTFIQIPCIILLLIRFDADWLRKYIRFINLNRRWGQAEWSLRMYNLIYISLLRLHLAVHEIDQPDIFP